MLLGNFKLSFIVLGAAGVFRLSAGDTGWAFQGLMAAMSPARYFSLLVTRSLDIWGCGIRGNLHILHRDRWGRLGSVGKISRCRGLVRGLGSGGREDYAL